MIIAPVGHQQVRVGLLDSWPAVEPQIGGSEMDQREQPAETVHCQSNLLTFRHN